MGAAAASFPVGESTGRVKPSNDLGINNLGTGSKVAAVDDRILLGLLVVARAHPHLDESTAPIKRAGGGIGGAHLQQNRGSVPLPRRLQQPAQKLSSHPL